MTSFLMYVNKWWNAHVMVSVILLLNKAHTKQPQVSRVKGANRCELKFLKFHMIAWYLF